MIMLSIRPLRIINVLRTVERNGRHSFYSTGEVQVLCEELGILLITDLKAISSFSLFQQLMCVCVCVCKLVCTLCMQGPAKASNP